MKLNKILLIDDDRPTNYIHKVIIERAEITKEIIIQQNAEKALELLKTCPTLSESCPELILLDINMPGMDGWEFLDHYKTLSKEQQSKNLVVMLTTSLNPLDKKRAESYPEVQAYINKPLTVETLQNTVNQLFTSS